MDRLVRFEKTSKNVKAVDAHHYTCISSTTTTTTGYVPVKAATKGLLPKIDWKSRVTLSSCTPDDYPKVSSQWTS